MSLRETGTVWVIVRLGAQFWMSRFHLCIMISLRVAADRRRAENGD